MAKTQNKRVSLASAPLGRWQTLTLAMPILLANSAAPLVGLVDTAIIGRLGDQTALAAIALGAVIYGIVYWGFGFLRMSTAGLSAQADGAANEGDVQAHLARAVPLGLAIGTLILALQLLLLPLILLAYPAEPEVEALARDYLSIRLWGLPATLAGLALMGWFIGLGRPKAALIMQIILNLLNAALSVYFVINLGWGIKGIAAASAIAEWTGFLAGLYLAAREIRQRGGLQRHQLTKPVLLDPQALKQVMTANNNIFIRTMALIAGFQFFNWQAANQGAIFLASNYILMQFFNITALLLDSFAHVAEAATGATFGAKDRAKFRRAVRITTEFSAGLAVIATLIIWTGGPVAIDWLTTDIEVRNMAKTYLPFCAIIPMAGFAAWQLDGIFIGTTQTKSMRDASLMAVFIYMALHYAIVPWLGPAAIWVAFIGYYMARAVTLLPYFSRIYRQF